MASPASGSAVLAEQRYGRSQEKHTEKTSAGASELGVVTIEFNPGPDAQDRLRRPFTLLVKYASEDKLPAPDADSSSEDGSEVEA